MNSNSTNKDRPYFLENKNVIAIITTNVKTILLLLITIPILSGCASILGKTSYPIQISSSPTDAHISIVNKKGQQVYSGTTPTTVDLQSSAGFFSKASYKITFSSEGYEDKVVPVNAKLNPWYFGNILLGGVIGMLIVDPASGAMWQINEYNITEILTPNTPVNKNENTVGTDTISVKFNTDNINTLNSDSISAN